jgi:hypothetical protein
MLAATARARFRAALHHLAARGEPNMGDAGRRDKGNKEERKKSKLTQKEKRKLKKEKNKNKSTTSSIQFPV